jgi:cytochrome b
LSAAAIRAWDLPTRIFHWTFATLVVFSFATGTVGNDWMDWHLRSGYAVLALLSFRVAWGFMGSQTARFASFLRGPRAVLAYARTTLRGEHPLVTGHNPLGGWMVVAMLATVALQAATGLFADDEIATRGPLAERVSDALVSRMSSIHSTVQWAVAGLVALHVAAIATYRLAWNVRLAPAMWHGRVQGAGVPPFERSPWLAAVVLALCGAAVYFLVVVYPSS